MIAENISTNGWDGDAELVDDYSKTMELIQELLADDCVFHPTVQNYLMIAAFSVIFCLSVIGNSVVVIVILQQRSMRSVTNIYLLNLALSDLLLSVVCMPPTLVSSLVYCWVFGDLLCKLLAYLQPVVVTASAYTLAAIALERYYAICKPLHSRVWHTRYTNFSSHAMLVIGFVWLISIVANVFMLFMYELRTYNRNGLNCAPKYDAVVHFAYQIYMTLVLLVIPLVVMTALYGSVIRSLRSGIKMDIAAIEIATTTPGETNGLLKQHMSESENKLHAVNYGSDGEKINAIKTSTDSNNGETVTSGIVTNHHTNNTSDFQRRRNKRASWSSMISIRRRNFQQQLAHQYHFTNGNQQSLNNDATTVQFYDLNNNSNTKRTGFGDTVVPSPLPPRLKNGGTINAAAAAAEAARSVRSTHSGRTALVKQRLIRMLIVIVIIFFCCWTPSYIWWLLLNAQDSFGTFNVWNSELNTVITVLTYLSSCTNPITYCFLNSKFRNALFLSFGCRRRFRHHHHHHRNRAGSGVCGMTMPKYGGGTATAHAHANGATRFVSTLGKNRAAGTTGARHHYCQHKDELVDDNNTLTENNSTTTGCHLCYADTHAPVNHCDNGTVTRMLNASGGRLLLRRVSSDFNGRASPRVCSPGPPDGRAFVNALGDDSRGKWQRSGDGADYATATNTPNDSTRSLVITFNVLSRLRSIFDFCEHRNAAKRLLAKRSESVVAAEAKPVLQPSLTFKTSSWDPSRQQRSTADATFAPLIPPLATSDTTDSVVVQPTSALPAPPKPPRSSPDKSFSSASASEYRSAAASSTSWKNTFDNQPTPSPPPIIRHHPSAGKSTSGTAVLIEFPKSHSTEFPTSVRPERADSCVLATASSFSTSSSDESSNRPVPFQDAVQEVSRYSAADDSKEQTNADAINNSFCCREIGNHAMQRLSNI